MGGTVRGSFERSCNGWILRHAEITPFAMRAFVRVLQAIDIPVLNVQSTNQTYFEVLEVVGSLSKQNVHFVQRASNVDESADLIFTEIHMNNVASRKQFAQDIRGLLQCLGRWRPLAPVNRTLVVDITLNALADSEVIELLDHASELVQDGTLNLVLIQSLTKFNHFRLDKLSGGLLFVFNSESYWDRMNQNYADIAKDEELDPGTQAFFRYFLCRPHWIQDYVQRINEIVNCVLRKTMNLISALEVLSTDALEILVSGDEKSCYIALSLAGLIVPPAHISSFCVSCTMLSAFTQALASELIVPLCRECDLPISERMSIGFPMTSMLDSLRITIGFDADDFRRA